MRIDVPAVVIGGGITGLACALHLKQAGLPVLLLEASDRPGGVVQTLERNGFLFESGPQCPRFPAALWTLAKDAGLEEEFVPGDTTAPRYILKNGHLHKVPFSLWEFLATTIVGPVSKVRLVWEGFRRSSPPPTEETLADFIRRKFGSEFLDYLVDPFISTVFAGDPDKIGVESAFPFLAEWERKHGSVLRGGIIAQIGRKKPHTAAPEHPEAMNGESSKLDVGDSLPSLGSFRRGLGVLPERLAEKLGDSIWACARAESLSRIESKESDESAWRIRLEDGREIVASAVVVTLPSFEAARILERAAPDLSENLAAICYAPMAVVSSGYNRAQVRNSLRGFGLMIPRRENRNTFFCFWNSSVLPGRARDGQVLITCFAGGASRPEIVENNEKTIAGIVEGEVGPLLGIKGDPVDRAVWKFSNGLPQFNVGHKDRIAAIQQGLRSLPGVHLGGNYWQGRSLGDCVENAFQLAGDVKRQLLRESVVS